MKLSDNNLLWIFWIVGAGLLVGGLLSGCSAFSIDDLRGQVDQAQDVNDGILAQVQVTLDAKAEVDADIATMPPGPKREKLEKASATLGVTIDTGIAWLDRANASLEQMKVRLATAENPEDVAVAAAETAAPFIPAPYGTALVGLMGLGAGLVRAWRIKKAGKESIRSVEGPVSEHLGAGGDSEFDKRSATLRKTQSPGARKLIDEARGKTSFALPF